MSFMKEIDTGGSQGQTQVSPEAIKSAREVSSGAPKTSGASGSPGITQSAIEFARSLLNSQGSLADKPIEPVSLLFSEASSSVRQFLMSPIMSPLYTLGGIMFPNTPQINVTYTSSYSPIELSHSNYDYQSYNKSSIQSIAVNAKLTAQTLAEADYMLAVIHFFRTYSKMNYGRYDIERGQPPAILKISAYGDYMIKNHPVSIRNFTLNLPDHMDYVQTSHNTQVPVYLEINIDLVTMMTPNDVKNEFTLDGFASGRLISRGYL